MRVTIDTILDGEEYTARPGIEYEIAPGATVKMRVPTQALVDRYNSAYLAARKAHEEAAAADPDAVNDTDYQMAILVTDGEWPEDRGDTIPMVVSRVHEDFFSFRLPRLKPQEEYLKRLTQLATQANAVQGTASSLQPGTPPEGD